MRNNVLRELVEQRMRGHVSATLGCDGDDCQLVGPRDDTRLLQVGIPSYNTINQSHTHTPGTTRVSRYQKCKTNRDFLCLPLTTVGAPGRVV